MTLEETLARLGSLGRSIRCPRWLLGTGLLLTLVTAAPAQEIYLLLPPHDARARGMGLAGAASIDMPGSITLNPAAIAAATSPTVVANLHTPQYADYLGTLAFAMPAGDVGSFAGFVTYGGTEVQVSTRENGSVAGEFLLGPYLMIGAGWGYPIGDVGRIGLRGRWLSATWSREAAGNDIALLFTGTTFLFDAGAHSHVPGLSSAFGLGDSAFGVGIAVANVGADLHYTGHGIEYDNPIPTFATLGVVLVPVESRVLQLSVAADLRYLLEESFLTREGRVQYGSGFEAKLLGRYMLRAGITTLDPGEFGFDLGLSAGAGVRFEGYDISLAYAGRSLGSQRTRLDLSIGARFH